MSLSPIPARMLHDTAVFSVVTGMDRYQNKTYEEYTVNHVHIQASQNIIKKDQDTEVQLRAILFVDSKRSTPVLDLYEMQQESLAKGDTMRVKVYSADGSEQGDYAVLIVDDLPDVPANRRHHWELSLV